MNGGIARHARRAFNDHTCYVDCEPTERGGHDMYPAEPNRDAGRYQAARNISMTRREYRASGQDETRECRMFDFRRGPIAPDSRRNLRRIRELLAGPDCRTYSDDPQQAK